MKKQILILMLLTPFIWTQCVFDIVKGNHKTQTETRSLTEKFTKLDVSEGIEVIMENEKTPTIKVETDENLLPLLKTEVREETLFVYFDGNVSQRKSSKVFIGKSDLEAVYVSSAGSVYSENKLTADSFEAIASSAGDIKLHIDTPKLKTNTSSSGEIILLGHANVVQATASSGGTINLTDMHIQRAEANASSGADIEMFCTEEIKAYASSGGSIEVTGHPKLVHSDKSSGGSVEVK